MYFEFILIFCNSNDYTILLTRSNEHIEIVCKIHKVQQASCCSASLKQAVRNAMSLRSWMYRAHHFEQDILSSKQQFVSVRAVSQLSDTVLERRRWYTRISFRISRFRQK